jgi:uncharacterized protein YgfB (UPF0149 family)
MMQVTFAEFASVLQDAAATVDAAEGHGCLCGALCTSSDYTMERWVDELIAEDRRPLAHDNEQVLRLVFAETVRALRGDEMEFAPLLPEEDGSLEQRATTIAQWCQGFLYGFGTGRALPPAAIPDTVDEVLRDVAHIGSAIVDVGAAGEDEEQAYAEIFEYLRVGVQLVHDELAAVRDSGDAPPGAADDRSLEDDQFD